jgi:hypothetical protein
VSIVDVMNLRVVQVSPEASVQEANVRMDDANVG